MTLNNFQKFVLLAALALVAFLFVNQVRATVQDDFVTICHATGSQQNPYQQLSVNTNAVDGVGNSDHNRSGHQGGEDIIPPGIWDVTGRNWTVSGQAIWNNNCNVPQPTVVPTNTPTPTETVQPTVTPTPTVEQEPTPTVTPTEEVTPTPTDEVRPTPTETPTTAHNNDVLVNNTTQAPGVCIPRHMRIKPTIWQVGRIDSDTVYARWTSTEDYVQSYVVWYGLWDGDMRWNTFVTGNYVELNGVPNTHIWIAAQSTDGCGTGPLGVFIDP